MEDNWFSKGLIRIEILDSHLTDIIIAPVVWVRVRLAGVLGLLGLLKLAGLAVLD
jgi:hypothetical protein